MADSTYDPGGALHVVVGRVQARGQVTVPQEIREACGVVPGSELLFIPTGEREFVCRVLPPARPLSDVVEQYTLDGTAPDIEALRAAMAQELARERAR
jgi:bifunctional DNA-binding transcriptional regulator/antitoxin component of YhaV-PrlF toxin-antitoxin module